MALISEAELNALSTDLEFARDSRCQIWRNTRTRDSGGATKYTWAKHGPEVSCRVEQQSRLMQEGLIGGRVAATAYYDISMHRQTDVGPDDRVEVLGKNVMLEITGVPGLETYAAEITVAAVRVE